MRTSITALAGLCFFLSVCVSASAASTLVIVNEFNTGANGRFLPVSMTLDGSPMCADAVLRPLDAIVCQGPIDAGDHKLSVKVKGYARREFAFKTAADTDDMHKQSYCIALQQEHIVLLNETDCSSMTESKI